MYYFLINHFKILLSNKILPEKEMFIVAGEILIRSNLTPGLSVDLFCNCLLSNMIRVFC